MTDFKKTLGKAAGAVKKAGAKLTGEAGILAKLQQEHGEVSALMKQVKLGSKGSREELFPAIRVKLLAHAKAEEEVLYSQLARLPRFTTQIRAQRREHSDMTMLIARLDSQPIESDAWMETFEKLDEIVDAHVEQEEDELFPVVKKLYDSTQLEDFERTYMRRRDAEIKELERVAGVRPTGS